MGKISVARARCDSGRLRSQFESAVDLIGYRAKNALKIPIGARVISLCRGYMAERMKEWRDGEYKE